MERIEMFLARLGLSGGAGWAFHHFFGAGSDTLIAAYATLVFLDVMSGTMAAVIRHELRAAKMVEGAAKKLMGFVAISMGHVIDTVVGTGSVACNTMSVLLCTYEVTSITENLAVAGIIVPDQVQDLFARVLDAKADVAAKSSAKRPPAAPAAKEEVSP
jgi:toxin secretion/phage lysis holin